MFLSLKTLYRKRTVIWPFYFTQLYGLYLMTFYIYAILKKNNVYKNFILDVKNYFEYSGEKK